MLLIVLAFFALLAWYAWIDHLDTDCDCADEDSRLDDVDGPW